MERVAMILEGIYDGTVLDGWAEEADKGELVVAVEVQLTDVLDADEPVVCRHPAFGEWAHLAEGVVKHLGLDWPYGIERLAQAKGKAVRVRCKHKTYKGNTDARFYIITSERKRATAAALAAGLAKLDAKAKAADDSEIPF